MGDVHLSKRGWSERRASDKSSILQYLSYDNTNLKMFQERVSIMIFGVFCCVWNLWYHSLLNNLSFQYLWASTGNQPSQLVTKTCYFTFPVAFFFYQHLCHRCNFCKNLNIESICMDRTASCTVSFKSMVSSGGTLTTCTKEARTNSIFCAVRLWLTDCSAFLWVKERPWENLTRGYQNWRLTESDFGLHWLAS